MVGGVLGLQVYIDGQVIVRDLLWIILFFGVLRLSSRLMVWLATAASWSTRVFAIGFMLGCVLEFGAFSYWIEQDLFRFTPGVWTLEGWYPLSSPFQRAIVTAGWASFDSASLPALLAGMSASEILLGSGLFATWRCFGRHKLITRI